MKGCCSPSESSLPLPALLAEEAEAARASGVQVMRRAAGSMSVALAS